MGGREDNNQETVRRENRPTGPRIIADPGFLPEARYVTVTGRSSGSFFSRRLPKDVTLSGIKPVDFRRINRIKLTAAGTAPDLHRCSLLMLRRGATFNRIKGRRKIQILYLEHE